MAPERAAEGRAARPRRWLCGAVARHHGGGRRGGRALRRKPCRVHRGNLGTRKAAGAAHRAPRLGAGGSAHAAVRILQPCFAGYCEGFCRELLPLLGGGGPAHAIVRNICMSRLKGRVGFECHDRCAPPRAAPRGTATLHAEGRMGRVLNACVGVQGPGDAIICNDNFVKGGW